MEDLAIIVGTMLLVEFLLCLLAIVFSAVYRFKRKLAKTSVVFIVLMTALTLWALTLTPGFVYAPLVALVISAALRFLPIKK